jgi:hypothetical protein
VEGVETSFITGRSVGAVSQFFWYVSFDLRYLVRAILTGNRRYK